MKAFKTLLVSSLLLTSLSALAGGGGTASSWCGYNSQVITTCSTGDITLQLVKMTNWNFADSGKKCENGEAVSYRNDVILEIKNLGLPSTATRNPSGFLKFGDVISQANSGGGLVLNDFHKLNGSNKYVVSATVNVAWPDYQSINGQTFEELVICK